MRICTVVGARPQFIKAAAVSRAVKAHNQTAKDEDRIEDVLVHTGQHYDFEMSAVFFKQLGLAKPRRHLAVGSGTHGTQTGEMLRRVEEVLLGAEVDLVLVYGDTNTTLAGALAAAKLHLPVAHVEAGLRSFNRRMPEEVNRVVVDHISDVHFCPSDRAIENLREEGIHTDVFQVGDVMRDILEAALAQDASPLLCKKFGLEKGAYALATLHRAENTASSSTLSQAIRAVDAVASAGLPVLMPLHPRTRGLLDQWKIPTGQIQEIPPVSYFEMVALQRDAGLILTDSGGMQKEALWLGVPCLTLREETEWVETVESGWNRLVGLDENKILIQMKQAPPPGPAPALYGDGKAGERIVGVLTQKPSRGRV